MFNPKWAILQLQYAYHDENNLHFNEMPMMLYVCILDQHTLLHFIVLANWKNISLHMDIIPWFWANQVLLLLLYHACLLKEKQQIPIS